MFERITFVSGILGGRACIHGMRIPVSVLVNQLALGVTREELLEDIQQALEYAAWLTREEIHPASA